MTTPPESPPVELMRRLRREIDEEYKYLSREERQRRMRASIAEHPRPGRKSKLDHQLDEVRRLPRGEQQFVSKFLDQVLAAKKWAGGGHQGHRSGQVRYHVPGTPPR